MQKLDDDKIRNDMVPLHFTMTNNQYKTLRKMKDTNFIKIIYAIRMAAFYAIQNENILRKQNDIGYSIHDSKHYRISLKKEIYDEMSSMAASHQISKSQFVRIALNGFLYQFYKEDK